MRTSLLILLSFVSKFTFSITPSYKDLRHQSQLFGKEKFYRIYLPSDYGLTTKQYPVIYFFHGWGGRHFKDDSADLDYQLLGNLAEKYQFIMVMWDGNIDESEPRPYNIGGKDDIKFQIQMIDYFNELTTHIDTTYRSYSDRNNRGIIGYSMGGFLSMFIAGKLPDKVSALSNIMGSPEFHIGKPGNHTLYSIRYTLDNLDAVSVLYRNMDNCPLYFMNKEVENAVSWKGASNIRFYEGEGDHKVDEKGETVVFEESVRFLIDAFQNPIKVPIRWSHDDIYSQWSKWGYIVETNKNRPGYVGLKNVSSSGFRFISRKWLPDGPCFGAVATVTTAPIYKKNVKYQIEIISNQGTDKANYQIVSDKDGRIVLPNINSGDDVSILDKRRDYTVLNYIIGDGEKFIYPNKDNSLELNILQRGKGKSSKTESLKITVSCLDSCVTIENATQTHLFVKDSVILKMNPLIIQSKVAPPTDASPYMLRLKVLIESADGQSDDDVLLPVHYDVPYFKHIAIDDGIGVKSPIRGAGNGNRMVEPGESIILYENFQALRLFTNDPFVVACNEELFNGMLTCGIWPDGYTHSSIVKISEECPSGHTIEFLSSYETKTYMPIKRSVIWGKVSVVVK